MVFCLEPAEDKLGLVHGRMDIDESLEENPLNFTTSIKLSMKSHYPVEASGIFFFLHGTPKNPLTLIKM